MGADKLIIDWSSIRSFRLYVYLIYVVQKDANHFFPFDLITEDCNYIFHAALFSLKYAMLFLLTTKLHRITMEFKAMHWTIAVKERQTARQKIPPFFPEISKKLA